MHTIKFEVNEQIVYESKREEAVINKAEELHKKLVENGIDDFESTGMGSQVGTGEINIVYIFKNEDDLIMARKLLNGKNKDGE